jgi:uncharacterized protein YozE (UPF0346 family)
MRVSFYDYMIDNYYGEDSEYGDLVSDMQCDRNFDENETDINKLLQYFKSKTKNIYVMDVIEKSLEAYSNGRII